MPAPAIIPLSARMLERLGARPTEGGLELSDTAPVTADTEDNREQQSAQKQATQQSQQRSAIEETNAVLKEGVQAIAENLGRRTTESQNLKLVDSLYERLLQVEPTEETPLWSDYDPAQKGNILSHVARFLLDIPSSIIGQASDQRAIRDFERASKQALIKNQLIKEERANILQEAALLQVREAIQKGDEMAIQAAIDDATNIARETRLRIPDPEKPEELLRINWDAVAAHTGTDQEGMLTGFLSPGDLLATQNPTKEEADFALKVWQEGNKELTSLRDDQLAADERARLRMNREEEIFANLKDEYDVFDEDMRLQMDDLGRVVGGLARQNMIDSRWLGFRNAVDALKTTESVQLHNFFRFDPETNQIVVDETFEEDWERYVTAWRGLLSRTGWSFASIPGRRIATSQRGSDGEALIARELLPLWVPEDVERSTGQKGIVNKFLKDQRAEFLQGRGLITDTLEFLGNQTPTPGRILQELANFESEVGNELPDDAFLGMLREAGERIPQTSQKQIVGDIQEILQRNVVSLVESELSRPNGDPHGALVSGYSMAIQDFRSYLTQIGREDVSSVLDDDDVGILLRRVANESGITKSIQGRFKAVSMSENLSSKTGLPRAMTDRAVRAVESGIRGSSRLVSFGPAGLLISPFLPEGGRVRADSVAARILRDSVEPNTEISLPFAGPVLPEGPTVSTP